MKIKALSNWTTRDLMVTVVLGLVIMVVTIPLRLATTSLNVAFGPLASVPASAYVVLGGMFVAYVVRRPGAAVLSQIIIGLLLVLFMPGGVFLFVLYVIHGVAIELPFIVTGYRIYSPPFLAISGGIARLVILVTAWIPGALGSLSVVVQIGLVVGAFVGGAAAGVLARYLAEQLSKSGVIGLVGIADREISEESPLT